MKVQSKRLLAACGAVAALAAAGGVIAPAFDAHEPTERAVERVLVVERAAPAAAAQADAGQAARAGLWALGALGGAAALFAAFPKTFLGALRLGGRAARGCAKAGVAGARAAAAAVKRGWAANLAFAGGGLLAFGLVDHLYGLPLATGASLLVLAGVLAWRRLTGAGGGATRPAV